ncbi:MAG TPA: cellobiose phosphorylase, partial [Intrasporangium sp.]|nr:cellobiose phosphorylase [Intrasporangium sp.]
AGGFFDAIAVGSGTVARRYLSLDQAMIMGAVGNVLANNVIRRYFSTPAVEQVLRPVIGIEEFGASPV